jgi:hypothetical protein
MGEKDGVDVVLGQEHNLHPSREGELRRTAESRGFALVIALHRVVWMECTGEGRWCSYARPR